MTNPTHSFSATHHNSSGSKSGANHHHQTNNNNSSSSNAAIAMACTAGDKIKASAREFLRNLETWKQPSPLDGSTAEQQAQPSSTLDAALQKMFGSCTMGAEALEGQEQELKNDHDRLPGKRVVPAVNHQQQQYNSNNGNNGEHIYEQLFQDDPPPRQPSPPQQQHPRRITRPRNSSEQQPKRPKEVTPDSSSKQRRGFSIGLSPKTKQQQQHKKQPVCTPLQSDHLIVPDDSRFDDSISAISAYTLEAMEARHQAHSPPKVKPIDDSTLFDDDDDDEPQVLSPIKPLHNNSPVRRHRSHGSKLSKTTHTTDESSFEQRFADDEKQYWNKATAASPLHKNRSKEATSTAGSSHSFAHPHDTIPFEPGDLLPKGEDEEEDEFNVFRTDPDRLALVLPVDLDTEMAEI